MKWLRLLTLSGFLSAVTPTHSMAMHAQERDATAEDVLLNYMGAVLFFRLLGTFPQMVGEWYLNNMREWYCSTLNEEGIVITPRISWAPGGPQEMCNYEPVGKERALMLGAAITPWLTAAVGFIVEAIMNGPRSDAPLSAPGRVAFGLGTAISVGLALGSHINFYVNWDQLTKFLNFASDSNYPAIAWEGKLAEHKPNYNAILKGTTITSTIIDSLPQIGLLTYLAYRLVKPPRVDAPSNT